MKSICIIPARGGSKRILNKNIKEFCGKPIIAYSIETAIKSNLFDNIIVSTDSQAIADVAMSYGAQVPFMRDATLADDFSTTTDVIANAICELEKLGKTYDIVCCIYATAPLLNIENLAKGMQKFKTANKAFVFSVCEFMTPIFRAFKLDDSGSVEMFWPDNFKVRSQDLPKAYFDAAQFYFGTPDAFLQGLPVFANHSIGIPIPPHLVCDIDTPDDWLRAEAMYKACTTTH